MNTERGMFKDLVIQQNARGLESRCGGRFDDYFANSSSSHNPFVGLEGVLERIDRVYKRSELS